MTAAEFTSPTPRCGCPLCSNPPGTRMDSRMETVMTEPQNTESTAKDLDETRRLLYMTLAIPRVGRYAQIVGTAVNALAHHNLLCDADYAMAHLDAVVNSNLRGGNDQELMSEAWVKEQIAALTAKLESDTP